MIAVGHNAKKESKNLFIIKGLELMNSLKWVLKPDAIQVGQSCFFSGYGNGVAIMNRMSGTRRSTTPSVNARDGTRGFYSEDNSDKRGFTKVSRIGSVLRKGKKEE